MKLKPLLYIIGLFLVVGIVNALPPVKTEFVGDVGIAIQAPTMDYIKIGSDNELSVNCFNKSTGSQLTPINSYVGCEAYLFYPNGTHLLDIEPVAPDDDHWKLDFDENNITNSGVYGFTIHCNDSGIGGYLTDYFEATDSGGEPTTANGYIAIFIGMAIILVFFLYIGQLFNKEFSVLNEWKATIAPIKFIFISMAYLTVMAILRLGIILMRAASTIKVINLGEVLNDFWMVMMITYGLIFTIVMVLFGVRFIWSFVERKKYGGFRIG